MINGIYNELRNAGVRDFGLAGILNNVSNNGANLKGVNVPLKEGKYVSYEDAWKEDVKEMIDGAKNYNDLNKIGSKFDYVINSRQEGGKSFPNVDLFYYVFDASKKMREVIESGNYKVPQEDLE